MTIIVANTTCGLPLPLPEGRCIPIIPQIVMFGGAKKLLAELLEMKTALQIKDGQVAPFDWQRTKKRAPARLVHMEADKGAQSLVEELELAPAMVVHTGPRQGLWASFGE